MGRQTTENNLLATSQPSYVYNRDLTPSSALASSSSKLNPSGSSRDLSDRPFLSSEMIKNRLVAAAFVAYSYSGAEISYPSKPFLRLIPDAHNKVYSKTPHGHTYYRKMFWGHVMELVEELSEELQAIHLGAGVQPFAPLLCEAVVPCDVAAHHQLLMLAYPPSPQTASTSPTSSSSCRPTPKSPASATLAS